MKTNANLCSSGDLVIDTATVRKNVRVIKDSRATRRRQLSEPDERRAAGGLGGTTSPEPIVRAQPGKEIIVLAGRQVTRERLIEVVVSVYKSGQHDLPGEIEHLVGRSRKFVRQAD